MSLGCIWRYMNVLYINVEKGQDPKGWYVVRGDHVRLCVIYSTALSDYFIHQTYAPQGMKQLDGLVFTRSHWLLHDEGERIYSTSLPKCSLFLSRSLPLDQGVPELSANPQWIPYRTHP